MNRFWNKKLLTGIIVAGALVASGPASAASCSTFATIAAWAGAGAAGCTDPDGDTTFVFTSATLPGTSTFLIGESEVLGVDNYAVTFGFGNNGLVGGGNIVYTITATNLERFVAAGFDTTAGLTGTTSATKDVRTSTGSLLGSLTSTTGSHAGPLTFAPMISLSVTDTYAAGTGVIFSGENSFAATAVPEPESYAMILAGLGLMGYIARRRNRKTA